MRHLAMKFLRLLSITLMASAVMLPAAAEAQQAQQQPAAQLTPEEVFGDWAKVCQDAPDGGRQCIAVHNAAPAEGTPRILHISLIKIPEAQRPLLQLSVPLGVWLPQGLSLSVDGSKAVAIPLQICIGNACQVQFEMPDEMLNTFRNGLQGNVKMFNAAGQEVNSPFSLKGFTAALGSLG